MATAIFVSYRHDDTEDTSGRICDRLVDAFGKDRVFFDVHEMVAGDNFEDKIHIAINQSRILVAVVAPRWLELLQQNQREGKTDWVCYEIERAYERGLRVIPVRVRGGRMPAKTDLPAGVREFASVHAPEIRGGEHFDPDIDRLIAALRKELAVPIKRPSRFWDQGPGRQRGRIAIGIAFLILAAMWVWRDFWPPARPDGQALGDLLYNTYWVAYDPSGMTLDAGRRPVLPDEASVAADLDRIRAAGFSGIVTSTSNGVMERVPRLAQERGLRVIMGVWNPADQWELTRAIRQSQYVDAYCIGHEGYPNRYSLDQLERAVRHVKRRTGKPAAPSELASYYTPHLAQLGDWLFPDAHLTIRDSDDSFRVDVDRDVELFMAATQKVVPFAQEHGRPLVFHNVAYPYAGIAGASRLRQAEFYRRLLERVNDPQRGHSIRVAVVAQTAFDTPWKRGKPFYPWDPYCGLIEADRSADSRRFEPSTGWDGPLSPAGRAIRRWYPQLEPARDGRPPAHDRTD